MARALWLGAIAAGTVGTALVFASVTIAGLFTPGVVVIDAGLLLAVAAGIAELRGTAAAPARTS